MQMKDAEAIVSAWGRHLKSAGPIHAEDIPIMVKATTIFLRWAFREGYQLESYLSGEDYERQLTKYFPRELADVGDHTIPEISG